MSLTSLEICAGAGGQAIGIEKANFKHAALVEIDEHCCETLRLNRPKWNVLEADIKVFSGKMYAGIDLLAGGLPCPPFSKAGKQLGILDERNLFPEVMRLAEEIRPKAIMLENVRGFLDPVFEDFRNGLEHSLSKLGYKVGFKLFQSSDFGVPQLRPRVLVVALRHELTEHFDWPTHRRKVPTVGEALSDLMGENGWTGLQKWKQKANTIAPTIVGGSKKHGGPDLGPTRAKKAWQELGVNGHLVASEAPAKGFKGSPYLTVRMVARLQGFPDSWEFAGRKTHAYRQVGNAFPPPVARAVAGKIAKAFKANSSRLITVPMMFAAE